MQERVGEYVFLIIVIYATGASACREVGSDEQAPISEDRPQGLRPRGPEGMLRLQAEEGRKELPHGHTLCSGQHQLQEVQSTWYAHADAEVDMCTGEELCHVSRFLLL